MNSCHSFDGRSVIENSGNKEAKQAWYLQAPLEKSEAAVYLHTFTSYRAANWIHLGLSQGRGKMDRHTRRELPAKDIYLYPLHRRARERLRAM